MTGPAAAAAAGSAVAAAAAAAVGGPAIAAAAIPQDATAELRARRQRAMSAAQSARIRKGMIRYVLLVRCTGIGTATGHATGHAAGPRAAVHLPCYCCCCQSPPDDLLHHPVQAMVTTVDPTASRRLLIIPHLPSPRGAGLHCRCWTCPGQPVLAT
jgi:hypothetical protein